MAVSERRRSSLRVVATVLIVLASLASTQWLAIQVADNQRSDAEAAARAYGTQFAHDLKSSLDRPAMLGHAVEVYVRSRNGVLDEAAMDDFLTELSVNDPIIRSVAVAPHNRVKYIAPRLGNESVLGLYYPDVASQWPAIRAVIAAGRPALVGPVDLVQGGRGLAYRIPIRLGNGIYWGLVTVIIDLDPYLAEAGRGGGGAMGVALRTNASPARTGLVFGGPASVFDANPLLFPATPLNTHWTLAVVPVPVDQGLESVVRVSGALIAALLGFLVFALIGSSQRRREVSQRLADLAARVPGLLFQGHRSPDGTLRFPYVSGRTRDMFGLESTEVMGDGSLLWSRLAATDATAARRSLLAAAESGKPWHQRVRMRDRTGQEHWYQIDALPVLNRDGLLLHGFLADVTDQVAAEESTRISASVFATSRTGVLILDAHQRIISLNPGFTALTGYSSDDLIGRPLTMLGEGLTPAAVYDDIWSQVGAHGFWRGELVHRMSNGRVAAQPVTISVVLDESGQLSHQVVTVDSPLTLRDDVVTGLPGRQKLDDRLEQSLDQARATQGAIALVVLGLDHFHDINEALGQRVGDLVLSETARRLQATVPVHDTVARSGGDEFAILMLGAEDPSHVAKVLDDVMAGLARRFDLGEQSIQLTVSVGVTVFPNDASTAAGLITNANQAMRIAKEQGRNRYCFFTPEMQTEAQERARLTQDLRRALTTDELMVVFQPIVELPSRRIHKAEALLRWTHPIRGPIAPAEFIPVAEKSGLITEIGDWVFDQVLDMAATIHAQHPTFELSFNMSPLEVTDDPSVHHRRLQRMLERGIPGPALVLEITEGVLLDHTGHGPSNLRQYRNADLKFAIDDFGTGYSSLSYLQKLDVDYLKIDRSFINEIETVEGLALCQAIIEMAHRLGLRVVAEGIETEPQCDLLTEASCDLGQGYLFARPIPASELLGLLAAQASGADPAADQLAH